MKIKVSNHCHTLICDNDVIELRSNVTFFSQTEEECGTTARNNSGEFRIAIAKQKPHQIGNHSIQGSVINFKISE